MPKISVIIPVYKAEPYLRRCINSILEQTFDDFELILVDDGNDDNCPAICDEYAAKKQTGTCDSPGEQRSVRCTQHRN